MMMGLGMISASSAPSIEFAMITDEKAHELDEELDRKKAYLATYEEGVPVRPETCPLCGFDLSNNYCAMCMRTTKEK